MDAFEISQLCMTPSVVEMFSMTRGNIKGWTIHLHITPLINRGTRFNGFHFLSRSCPSFWQPSSRPSTRSSANTICLRATDTRSPPLPRNACRAATSSSRFNG